MTEVHDYSERLTASFAGEIQSEHFGASRNLSLEGVVFQTHSAQEIADYKNGVWDGGTLSCTKTMHSHFSDNSRQDAWTTFAHACVEFNYLNCRAELCQYETILLSNTNGCKVS